MLRPINIAPAPAYTICLLTLQQPFVEENVLEGVWTCKQFLLRIVALCTVKDRPDLGDPSLGDHGMQLLARTSTDTTALPIAIV
jgi:hypothetical protein